MGKTTLVGSALPEIEEGRKFLKLLSEAKIKIQAALWQKSELTGEWRLVIVTPAVEELGLKESYRRLDKILSTVPDPPAVDLLNVSLMTPDAWFYRSLHRELRYAHNIMVSKRAVGDHTIDEGFIYFVK